MHADLEHKPSVTHETIRLTEIMAEYLLEAPGIEYHGADGMTVEDVVSAGYAAAVVKGWVSGHDQLIACYPEMTEAIVTFFRNRMTVVPGSTTQRLATTNFE